MWIHTQVTYVHHIPEGRIIGFDCGIQSPYLHHTKPTIKVNNLYAIVAIIYLTRGGMVDCYFVLWT